MRVLVTGGAGYVGSALVPRLLSSGYEVNVLDLFLFGDNVFDGLSHYQKVGLDLVKGDVRNPEDVARAVKDCDAVIHLACISNDPCYELDPELSRSTDVGAFRPLIRAAKAAGVKRFIYASSSSVYGVKDDEDVTEDLPLTPLTRYSQSKVECEEILASEREPGFVTTVLRPATVCGWSPRLRLDVVVNILTASAYFKKVITVDGGGQMRASLHIGDMCRIYRLLLTLPDKLVDGKTWNVGCGNMTVADLAASIAGIIDAEIVVRPMVDPRSYRISSQRIFDDIGFRPERSIADAVSDLKDAFEDGQVTDVEDDRYYNIRRMKRLKAA